MAYTFHFYILMPLISNRYPWFVEVLNSPYFYICKKTSLNIKIIVLFITCHSLDDTIIGVFYVSLLK